LIGRLDDEDESVKDEALNSLANIGSERATEALIVKLKKEKNGFSISNSTYNALCKIGSAYAIQAVISKLSETNAFNKAAAILALRLAKSDAAITALTKELDSFIYKKIAAKSLIQIGTEEAILAVLSKEKSLPVEIIESLSNTAHFRQYRRVPPLTRLKSWLHRRKNSTAP